MLGYLWYMKTKINENFFEECNESSAYILGYIYADGSLSDRGRINSWLLDITSKDFLHLQCIAKLMNSKYKIGSKQTVKNNKKYNNFRLQITNRKICSDVKKIGLATKERVTTPPSIPERFYPDFIRGFFDGDGSIYIYKVNGATQLKGNFTAKDKKILLWLNSFFAEHLNFLPKNIKLPNLFNQCNVQYKNLAEPYSDCKRCL